MEHIPTVTAHGEPAAGAPIADLVPAGIAAAVVLAVVAAVGAAHRAGRIGMISRAAAVAERASGLPGWASLPAAIAAGSLIVAVVGFYWDVATHIDTGRDVGPFANPSHYLIITGLAGIALAGLVSVLLGSDSPTSVTVRGGWRAPVGGVLLLLCGGMSVLGFPLDDVWHRLFGQDVTLWSPTHLQMVGGAALSTLAVWMLTTEGRRAATANRRWRLLDPLHAGALLVGLSALQAEFDYSVPQFRLLYHPVLLMLAAGTALVAARMKLGRGGALKAVLVFIGLRGALSVLVGPVLGHTTLHFPLYVAEALAVEAAAVVLGTARPVVFGVASGAAVGTFGLAGEWAWSHAWMTIPWPASLLPEGAVLGVAAGVAGGVLGALIARALSDPAPAERPRRAPPRVAAAATVAAVVLLLAYPFPTGSVDGAATVSIDPVQGRDGGWVHATISIDADEEAHSAEWFNVTAWQGGGSIVTEPRPIGEGTYRTTEAIPVHGEWKTLIRLHVGDSLAAVPVFLPDDPAIPAPEVPAEPRFTRRFVYDKSIVLREAKDVSAALTYAASGALVALAASWVAVLGWGLTRLAGMSRSFGRRRGASSTIGARVS